MIILKVLGFLALVFVATFVISFVISFTMNYIKLRKAKKLLKGVVSTLNANIVQPAQKTSEPEYEEIVQNDQKKTEVQNEN